MCPQCRLLTDVDDITEPHLPSVVNEPGGFTQRVWVGWPARRGPTGSATIVGMTSAGHSRGSGAEGRTGRFAGSVSGSAPEAHTDPWRPAPHAVGDDYEARFERLAAAGHDVHGEASFVMGYRPRSVIDAGCGTGRVATELARRGVQVVGIDIDDAMLAVARRKAPDLLWITGDLERLSLRTSDGERLRADAVVAAGNVMIFLRPGTLRTVVQRCAAHLNPGGLVIAGFQLLPGGLNIDEYDAACDAAGLSLFERWSSWTRDPWNRRGGYVVAVHRSAADAPSTSRRPS